MGSTSTGPYDAIVVGGGHNGLVNAGYLAKAGLRTLVLEQRHLVGGAAITEEVVPGFSFTTFSYALSLLRPEIIHELDLVRHGFLPLMMPSSFHPTGDGGYLLLGDDHGQNINPTTTKYVVQDGEFIDWDKSEYATGKRKLKGR